MLGPSETMARKLGVVLPEYGRIFMCKKLESDLEKNGRMKGLVTQMLWVNFKADENSHGSI